MKKIILLLILPLMLTTFSGCDKDATGVFLFSIEDDKALGLKVDGEIKGSGEFAILDRSTNVAAYAYLDAMKENILNGGQIKFKDEFAWELNIIDDDSTLNAFCTPGGYIYVYTGLIKYLDNSSSLAGVMGHEIAHADRRHSSKQMQQEYGISILASLLSKEGEEPGLLTKVAASLTSLAFSRADEKQADEYSVKYLCPTDFDAAGAANFFEKIGSSGTPAFLSTHPNPENRVVNIRNDSDAASCSPDEEDPLVNGKTYDEFKAML